MKRSWFGWLAGAVLLGSVAGCSGSSGGGSSSGAQAALQAFAFKGLVANATVNVFALSANGVKGRELATGNTDAQGNINIARIAYTGWVMFALTGGIATDFLGNTSSIPSAFPLIGLALLTSGSPQLFVATALTTLVWYALQAELARALVPLGDAIRSAEARVALMFGLTGILGVLPALLAVNAAIAGNAADYGAALYGFCELAINVGIAEAELMHLMGRDLLDSLLDGQLFGSPLVALNAIVLSSSIWTVLFGVAITNFMNSSFNLSGLVAADIGVINALSILTTVFLAGPIIYSLFPTFFQRGVNNTITVRGENLPEDVADTEIEVGGQMIDPADITVNSDSIQFTLNAAVAANVQTGSSVKITDRTTGLDGFSSATLDLFNGQAQPTVDVSSFSPNCIPSGGGAEISIIGTDLSQDTKVTINGMSATVVAAQPPTRIHVRTPALDPGTYTMTFQNGSSSVLTVPNVVTAKEVDLNLAATKTDTGIKYTAGVQLTYNPTKTISVYGHLADYTDADQGTATVVRNTISDGNPTLQTDNLNVSVNRSRNGENESTLFFGSGYNFFTRSVVQGDFRAGNGPDAVDFGFDVPTNFSLQDIVGTFNVSAQWWNLEDDWRRHMWGSLVIDADGTASISLRCFTIGLLNGDIEFDELTGAFEVVTEVDGQITFSPIGTIVGLPELDVRFDASGCLGVATGTVGNSVLYAGAVRAGGQNGLGDYYGAHQGGALRERLQTSLPSATSIGSLEQLSEVSVDRTVVGCDFELALALRILESNTRSNFDGGVQFDWKAEMDPLYVNAGQLLAMDGRTVGAMYSDREKTIIMRHDLVGTSSDWSMQLGVPQYHTAASLDGDYFSAKTTVATEGDGSSQETARSVIGLFSYDPTNVPDILGHPFKQAGTRTPLIKHDTTITRDVARAVTAVQTNDFQGRLDVGYLFHHREKYELNLESSFDPSVFRVGYISPDSNAVLATDSAAARGLTERQIEFKTGGSLSDGNFSFGAIGRSYDLGNGDRTLQLHTGNFVVNGGMNSFSGSSSLFNENNTQSTPSISFTGTHMVLPDGIIELSRSDGAMLYMFPSYDGNAFAGVRVGTDGAQSLWIGTRETTVTPTVGNVSTLLASEFYTNFTPFPPTIGTSTGRLINSFSAPGQISQNGVTTLRDNLTDDVGFFQFFNTSSLALSLDGTAMYNEGGSSTTKLGSFSSGGVGFWADGGNQVFLAISIRY